MSREAVIERITSETSIRTRLNLDGTGVSNIRSGIPFFDHMLTLFARHGLFDLDFDGKGDIEVDFHHTVEDTGIVLGKALARALGDKAGIVRYGWAYVPMDETLARVAVDLSGRAYLEHRVPQAVESIAIDLPATSASSPDVIVTAESPDNPAASNSAILRTMFEPTP